MRSTSAAVLSIPMESAALYNTSFTVGVPPCGFGACAPAATTAAATKPMTTDIFEMHQVPRSERAQRAYCVPAVFPALNTCQVPVSRCCPTPGFDQSHTPDGKILRSRVISSAVNVTLVVGRAQRLQLALDDIVGDWRPCDAAGVRKRRIQLVALTGAILLLLDDSPAASRPCSSRRRRDPRAWRDAASQLAPRLSCPATDSSATGPSARAPAAARDSRCRSRRTACPGRA